ncbi:hypothetical protein RND81_06G030000 [Saponaria officinalis]|uniref:Mediator complex subunit 15 KIX domain-containing protein n=1 Tax=Saponaria officinalis TaxID=3572 RepID=A0AAW1K5R4_SAPOF
MDSNNWRPNQGEAQPPPMDGGDWRSQLQPDSRQRIVNQIMETLKRHLPFSGQEGVQELKQIAIRFEEKIYSAATSQSDYLRKVSLKMLTMESKSQSALPNAMPSNSAGRNPQDPVSSQNMQSQMLNQNQSVPLQMAPNQSQARQQLLTHNIPENMVSGALQTGVTLPTNGLAQNPMPNVPQNSNMQNTSSISQNSMENTMNPGIASSMFSNAQRQLQGRQQHIGSQQQHQQSHNSQQFMYQQQQQQRLLGQQNNIQNLAPQQPTSIQNLQQQQHLLGQQNNLQNIHQQQLGHQSHVGGQQLMGTQSGNASMQTSQQQSVQMMQPTKVPMQQQTQNALSGVRGQQQLQSQSQQQLMSKLQSQPTQVQQQLPMQPQSNALLHIMHQRMQNMNPSLQQQNLTDQQKLFQAQRATPEAPSKGSLDSTAQTGSVNGCDWQEEVYQKIKSMKDLYYADLSEMYQKISFKLHQHESLPQQPNIEQIEKLRVFKNMLDRLMQVLQITKNNISPSHKEKLPLLEKQIVNLLKPREPPQLHSYQQQHPQIPQAQSHDGGANSQMQILQQPLNQQGQQPSQMQAHQMAQLQQLNDVNEKTRHLKSGSLDSTAQTGSVNGGDWQEEVFQKIKSMKDLYYADLSEMYQKISFKLQQHESLPQQPNIEQIEKLRVFKNMLDRLMQVLQITKNNISPSHKEKLPLLEKQIVNLLKPREPPQLHSYLLHSYQQQHPQIPQAQSHDGGANSQMQILQQQLNQQGQQPSQMQAHQMAQLQQLNDVNKKTRHLKSGAFAHLSSAQRFMNHQVKPGASFPVSPPQLLNAVSPQRNHHSSPQIDPQILPPSVSKAGTPLHSANSRFVPSPSTPLVPSFTCIYIIILLFFITCLLLVYFFIGFLTKCVI